MSNGLYVAIGDSVTWRVADENYPAMILRKINQDYTPIRLANKGLGGSTTEEWLLALGPFALGLAADLVTIALGMNDCAANAVGTVKYGENLRWMVDQVHVYHRNASIILCAPNNTSDGTRTPYIQDYRDEMQAVATEKDVLFCDFSQAFTDTATYTTDGVHPNVAGQKLMADILYPIVQQTRFINNLM